METTTNSNASDLTITDINAPTDQGCGCGGCGCGAAESDANGSETANATPSEAQASVTQTFGVTGMTCEHCIASVTEELSEIAGVASVAVELNVGGDSAVTVKSATPLTTDAVRAAIEDAGYKLVTPTA